MWRSKHRHSNSGTPFFLIWSLPRLWYGSLSGSSSWPYLPDLWTPPFFWIFFEFIAFVGRFHYKQCWTTSNITKHSIRDRYKPISKNTKTLDPPGKIKFCAKKFPNFLPGTLAFYRIVNISNDQQMSLIPTLP
jgi:hypothetical protein